MSVRSRRVVVSDQARRDLQDISAYTARRWGRAQMKVYRGLLSEGFARLGRFPELGRIGPEYGEGLHSHRVGEHEVVYKVTERAVEIVGLRHVRRSTFDDFDRS